MAYSKARRLADIVVDTNGNINVPTQSASDNDTSAASTAYVTTAISGLIDSAPDTLNTLNEIAAALNDDANFNTTVTNSIAAKLPLGGGTMTGNIAHASDFTLDIGGGISLDADDEGTISFKDGGTRYGIVKKASNNFEIQSMISDGDLVIKGNDDGSTITALTLDMSAAGKAIFNSGGLFGSHTRVNGDFSVSASSGEDRFAILPQSTGSGTILMSGNEALTGYEPLTADFEDLRLRTSGTERMRIATSGNVGIGTDAPAEKLEVSGGHIKISNAGNTNLYINANNSGSDATIFFEEQDSVKAKVQHDASNDSLLFTDGSYTDTMTLKGAKVGIGTTSPSYKLDVSGTGDTVQYIANANPSGQQGRTLLIRDNYASSSQDSKISYAATSSPGQDVYLGKRTTSNAGYFHLTNSSGTEHLTVNMASGNVGVGTTTPDAKFEVEWTGTHASTDSIARITAPTYPALEFYSTNTNSSNRNWKISSVYNSYGTLEFLRSSAANGVPNVSTLAMTNTGQVGIGTHNPETILHIEGDTNSYATAPVLYMGSTSGANAAVRDWAIGPADDNYGNFHIFRGTSTGSNAVGNEGRVFTVSSAGNVGIGTSDPTYKLDVAGDIGVNEYIYHNNDTNTYMRFQADAWLVRAGGDDRIYVDGTNGRVGIGTNSPTKELDVRGGSGSGTISHAVFTGTAGRGLEIRSRSDTAGGQHSGTAEINAQDTEGNGGQLAFSTGGTIRAFLNHNGLGIGTTDPAKLGLTGSSVGKVINLSGDDCQVRLANSILHHDNSGNTTLHLRNHYTSLGSDNAARIKIESGTITFGSGTSYTERMRVVSNGTIHIGTGGNNEANGSTGGCSFSADSSNRRNFICATTGTGTLELIEFRNPNGTVGDIKTSGSSTSYSTSSDYRLKENVNYSWDATTRLKQLKPARFNFIADADTTMDGFLAHEVQDIVPQSVSGEKDGMTDVILYEDGDEIPSGKKVGDVKTPSVPKYQGIDHSKLVPLLVKTIQELEARIATLEG